MENQKMPEYETIRAAVAGEKWAVEKVVELSLIHISEPTRRS